MANELQYITEDLQGMLALIYNGECVGMQLPTAVDLKITECDPAVKGNSATSRTKPATLETGLVVQVPEYLKQGETDSRRHADRRVSGDEHNESAGWTAISLFAASMRPFWPAIFFFADFGFVDALCFRPPKMFSQLSANFFVAPTRVTLMIRLLSVTVYRSTFGVAADANFAIAILGCSAVLEFFIAEALRFVCALADPLAALFFVGLEIAFAPVDVAVAFEGQDVRRQPVEEPAVVADDDRAAGEVGHRFFQGPQRVDVEVVRRFVEQQHVRAAAQQLGQVDAVPLAAGEDADLLLLVGAGEIEPRDVGPGVQLAAAHFERVVAAGDFLVDGVVGHQVVAALIDVAEFDGRADLELALVGLLPGP